MKAIISPYEKTTLDNKTMSMPCVVIDTKAESFSSSNIPSTILDSNTTEYLIYLNSEDHAAAVALGYTEVDV